MDEKEAYLDRLRIVAEYATSLKIENTDWDSLPLPKGRISLGNILKRPALDSIEFYCDVNNIPKWWRQVYNCGSSIAVSLSWALAWSRYLNEQKTKSQCAEFLDFVDSKSFCGEAWFYSKYYLDNAIFRLHSYREKLAWLLNSHAKLCFINTETNKQKMSFSIYCKKANKKNPELCSLLYECFDSEETRKLMKTYRHEFVHNETPYVDWPKETQIAPIQQEKGKLLAIPGQQPPDFELDFLLVETRQVWKQFVDGTNKLANYLNDTYYAAWSTAE